MLSVIFALPYYSRYWTGEIDVGLLLLASPFIVLALIILVIWTRIRSYV